MSDKHTDRNFREELEALINRHSMENGSDTPDFILAEYLFGCLSMFDHAVNCREGWYGRTDMTALGIDPPEVPENGR